MRGGTFSRSRDVLWRRSLDAVLILPTAGSEPLTLAGSGPELWELLEVPMSMPDLASALAARHEADVEVVARDIEQVLEGLVNLGIVEETAG